MNAMTTIIWDTETGGVESRHPTIEIGAIAVSGWEELDAFEVRIRFDEAQADPEALSMNSYDPEIWKAEAVEPEVAIARLDDWLRQHAALEKVSKRTGNAFRVARVSGWNVRFDCDRIERGFKAFDRFLPAASFEALDWMQVARGYFWDLDDRPENMRLTTVADHFGIPTEGAHGALADCRLTLAVARRMVS